MNETQIPVPGQQVTLTFLPGHALERQLTGRTFEAFGATVIQPAGYQSDEFLSVVLSNGQLNPNLRIDSIS